jgi:hypothetical protein
LDYRNALLCIALKRRRRRKKRKLANRYINAYASHRINKKEKRKTSEALHKWLCFASHSKEEEEKKENSPSVT